MGMHIVLMMSSTCQQNEYLKNTNVKSMCKHTRLCKIRNNRIMLVVHIIYIMWDCPKGQGKTKITRVGSYLKRSKFSNNQHGLG